MLVEFSRDTSTGALTELGCVSDGASGCATEDAAGSNNPRSLALSPNGDYLYEVGAENELVTFSREPATGPQVKRAHVSWLHGLRLREEAER